MAFPHAEVVALVRLARLEFAEYLAEHGRQLAVLLVALAGLLFFALRRPAIAGAPYVPPAALPLATALAGAGLGALLLLSVLAPRGPLAFYRLIGFAIPLLAGVLATRTFARSIPATVWALMFACSSTSSAPSPK